MTQLLWVLDQTEALTFCRAVLDTTGFICPSVTVSHTGPEAARQIFISNYHFSFFCDSVMRTVGLNRPHRTQSILGV